MEFKKQKWNSGFVLGLLFTALIVGGCTPPDSLLVHQVVADATGTITGKLIDGSTRAPIGNATVSLIYNGGKAVTTTNPTTDADLTGSFVFGGIPAGSHTIKFEATGYATLQQTVTVFQSADNTPLTVNLGLVALGTSFDLTVLVTDVGTALAGVSVFAEPDATSEDCYKFGDFVEQSLFDNSAPGAEISGVTGSNGEVVLSGLNRCTHYLIVAPYQTVGSTTYITVARDHEGSNSDDTITLALQLADRDDSISIIAGSSDRLLDGGYVTTRNITDTDVDPGTNYSTGGTGGGITPLLSTQPLKVVFNYPVSLSGPVNYSFLDDLISPVSGADTLDPNFPVFVDDVAVVGSLDSTGTVLTVNPPTGGFPINEIVNLNFSTVSAIVNGVLQTYNGLGSNNFYVADDTATGFSSTTALLADNYNGDAAGAGTGSGDVFLVFPEYVQGSIRIISVTHGTTVTIINGGSSFPGTSSGDVVYTEVSADSTVCPTCGSVTGTSYRINLGQPGGAFADDDEIEVAVDLTDVEGNHLITQVALTVQ